MKRIIRHNRGMTRNEAIRALRRRPGTRFDSGTADTLVRMLDRNNAQK